MLIGTSFMVFPCKESCPDCVNVSMMLKSPCSTNWKSHRFRSRTITRYSRP